MAGESIESRGLPFSSSSKYNNPTRKNAPPPPPPSTTSSSITNNTIDRNVYNKTKTVGRKWVLDSADDNDEGTYFPSITGTCVLMCPVEERLQRERLRDLAVFERLHGNPSKSSPTIAVKKFCRTISRREIQASSVRPLLVLEETLKYLLSFLDSAEHPFEVVHDFIFDRTRSIRQDLCMQCLTNNQVISIYERMVKFHVLSLHKLQKYTNPNIPSMLHLNLEQLTKSLMTLINLYEENRTSESLYENEAEFCSLYMLLHIHPDIQGKSLSLWLRCVPSTIMRSKEMCFARKVLKFFRLGNFYRFMHITETEASYLQYCIIESYVNEVRALAICCLNYGGYKPQPFPLANLSKLLVLKDSDVESFCNDCGLETSSDKAGERYLPTKQTSFCHPKKRFQKYYPLDSERLHRLSNDFSVL